MLEVNFNPFPVLYTERLSLRQVTKLDAPDFFLLRSNKTVMKYIGKKPMENLEEAVEFLNKITIQEEAGDSINWAITLKGDPKLIGVISIWNIAKQHFRGELGYTLLPEYHAKGIMNEALNAVINYGFNTMKLHSLEAHIHSENVASIKLLEKNKFIREGYFKENYCFEGVFSDSAVYSLLKSEQ